MSVMDKFYPFNSVNNDRVHDADDLAKIIRAMITNGVVMDDATALQVVEGGNFVVRVSTGTSIIEGRIGIVESEKVFDAPVPSLALDRYDLVVAKADYAARNVRLAYVMGSPSSVPEPPPLQDDVYGFDIPLAQIEVKSNAARITQADITDLRTACDFIIPKNTEALFAQFRSVFENFMDGATNTFGSIVSDMEATREEQLTYFINWFETIQDTLDGDTAGNLLNLIHNNTAFSVFATIPAENWQGSRPYTQTITIPPNIDGRQLLAGDRPLAMVAKNNDPKTEKAQRTAFGLLWSIESTADGEALVTCLDRKPRIDIDIEMRVVR